ncbi:MAG: cisplatin damage response ATP-dependent DNA ligase [Bryobacteraceae bacterium]
MKAFAELYTALDETTKTNAKVEALTEYLRRAPPEDAAWAVHFLIGRRPKRLLESRKLAEWAIAEAGVPEWLFADCYHAVGDFAETIALLLPPPTASTELPLHYWVETRLLPLAQADDATRRARLVSAWREMDERQRFAWTKLITGEFRVGVSQSLVVRAIAAVGGLSTEAVSHRLMGEWQPTAEFWRQFLTPEIPAPQVSGLQTPALQIPPPQGSASEIAAPKILPPQVSGPQIPVQQIPARQASGLQTPAPQIPPPKGSASEIAAAQIREADISRPYPFCLAYPIEGAVEELGDPAGWQVEWKWDGIRAQLIRRQSRSFLWSRGEELVTGRFPEIEAMSTLLPEGVAIDGEVVPWKDGAPQPFAKLQRRIGRKALGNRILAEVPVVLMAFDLLEFGGQDVRERPLEWRRAQLEALSPRSDVLVLSPLVEPASWEALRALRSESRARQVEGFMLKRRGSPYRVGRRRGDWWKWKIDPYSVDAVLIYAQPGSGRRASLFTDYTFGIWDQGKLVPFAKAYSGLSGEEIRAVDEFVRRNTIETFGPVHAVKPELVFELAFEGIQLSSRHRSGIAVRFPRMARWRHDKRAEEADTMETIRALLGRQES